MVSPNHFLDLKGPWRLRHVMAGIVMLVRCVCAADTASAQATTSLSEPYAEFHRLCDKGQLAAAIKAGQSLFEGIGRRHESSHAFREVSRRLEIARTICEQIRSEVTQARTVASDQIMADLLAVKPTTPRAAPAAASSRRSARPTPVAAGTMYRSHAGTFASPIVADDLPEDAASFLKRYYDLQMRTWIGEAARAARPVVEFQTKYELYHYLMVLPLLHHPASGFTQDSLSFLPEWMRTGANMQVLEDFCLLGVGRVDAAVGVARTSAAWANKPFEEFSYLNGAAERCQQRRRVDLGCACLRHAIALRPPTSEDAIAAHFRMVEMWAGAGNPALAAGECKAIANLLAATKPRGWERASYLRVKYLAQSDVGAALTEVQPLAEDPALNEYRAQVVHLQWELLRRANRGEESARVMKAFLAKYRDQPVAADMYYTTAVDCLAQQRYEDGCRILEVLLERFPKCPQAQEARDLHRKLQQLSKGTSPKP